MSKLSEWLKNDSIPVEQRAKQFLNKGGFKTDIKNPEKLLDKLSKKFPDQYMGFFELSELRAGDGRSYPEIYDVKNEIPEFSLMISSIFQGDVWSNFIGFFIHTFDELITEAPKRILDLGSDNGIISCFLAAYFPESEVVGVERSENGIKTAKSVAQKLGVENIEFVHSDISTFLNTNSGTFDLINSLTFMKEATRIFESPTAWALNISQKEANLPEICEESLDFLKSLSSILNADSFLLCCERIGNSDGCRLFFDHFNECGFEAKFNSALHLVNWQKETEILPIFLFLKSDTKKDRISFVEANEIITNIDRSLAESPEPPVLNETYTAWLLFDSIEEKKLISGVLLVYEQDEGAIMLGETWQTKYCTIWIKRSVRGYGELSIYSGCQNAYAFEKLKSIIMSHEQRKLGEIFEYQSLESLNKKLTDLGHPELVI